MLLIQAGNVETNPGPTTTCKQVWICDICHRFIQVRKRISIRCNRIEHWVHLRCTEHTIQIPGPAINTKNLDSQHHTTLPYPGLSRPPTHITATKTQTHIPLSPCSSRIGEAQIQSSHPQHLPPRPEPNTYTWHTHHNQHITCKTDGHSPTIRKLTGHNSWKTVCFRSDYHTHQYTHCQQNFHKHHTDGRQAQHTK